MNINKVLKENEKLIKDNIDNALNYNIGYDNKRKFLANLSIEKDDIFQEVCIKLWKLLENEYNPKYDLKTFIGYQSIKHATWLIRNLTRTGTAFTGSTDYYSHRGTIDKSKVSLNGITELFEVDEPNNKFIHKNNILVDDSYLFFGEELDSYYLIDKVCKNLNNEKLVNIFLFILNNQSLFSKSYKANNILSVIKQHFGYTTEEGAGWAYKKVLEAALPVIEEYKSE